MANNYTFTGKISFPVEVTIKAENEEEAWEKVYDEMEYCLPDTWPNVDYAELVHTEEDE